jgi:mannose-6-phosphate isomerase-like protein (cupin superfamily)
VSGVAIDVATVEQLGSIPAGVDLRTTLHEGNGCPRLVQRILRLGRGASFEGETDRGGELWYLKCGTGQLEHGAHVIALQPDMAVFLPEKTSYRLVNDGDAELELTIVELPAGIAGTASVPWRLARLTECAVETTGDRRFSVLFGPATGFEAATQFVGEIPFGRAPAHKHTYDEVVHVMGGNGIVHLDGLERPISAGSCIYIPPHTPHCLENTGTEILRVLGVFHPGGSPAAKTAASDR